MLAHYRGSGPRLALVVEAVAGAHDVFNLDKHDGEWTYMHDITFVGLAFKLAHEQGKQVETVQVIPRLCDESVAHRSGSRLTVLPIAMQAPVVIFPFFCKQLNSEPAGLVKCDAAKVLLKSLIASQAAGCPQRVGQRCRRGRRGHVQIVPSRIGGDGSVEPDSDATSYGDSASEALTALEIPMGCHRIFVNSSPFVLRNVLYTLFEIVAFGSSFGSRLHSNEIHPSIAQTY